MSDELFCDVALQYRPTNLTQKMKRMALKWFATMSGGDHILATQEIGTSEEALDVGNITTTGYIFLVNLDSTNYVEVGLTGSYPIKVPAGEGALFKANGTIYAKANSSACVVEYMAMEA